MIRKREIPIHDAQLLTDGLLQAGIIFRMSLGEYLPVAVDPPALPRTGSRTGCVGQDVGRLASTGRACHKRLRGHPRRVADEEDVALSAFGSFCQRAANGRFPQLQDRDDLWRLLVVIAARKAVNLVHHDRRQRRGGGRVRGESALQAGTSDRDSPGLEQIVGREPTPEFAALVAEEYERLLGSLEDDAQRNVALSKLEGYSNEEIAQKLACSLRTVERKLGLIRKRLSLQATDR